MFKEQSVALIETTNKYIFIFLNGEFEGASAYTAVKNIYNLDHMKKIAQCFNYKISDKIKIYNNLDNI